MALISLAALTVAAPLVPDVLNGFGTALHFQVVGQGQPVEGGAYDWTDGCIHCLIDITISSGTFVNSDSQSFAGPLDPGLYEIADYTGLFMFTQNAPHDFSVELHGWGQATRLS